MLTKHEINTFTKFNQTIIARLADRLAGFLPTESSVLVQAMRYSLLNGGKRLRAQLVYAVGKLLKAPLSQLDVLAASIEMIHAFSLIHDDLPAMDNDILRRGQPTCHIAFDEATAILAGDALQTLAFQIVAEATAIPITKRVRMMSVLARASGHQGMAGGQYIDMHHHTYPQTLATLEMMHALKTGKLIHAAIKLAQLASPLRLSQEKITALDQYAQCIGLAFQIQDDVLDITSTSTILGKTTGKDSAQSKLTYPDLLGLKTAQDLALSCHQQALDALASFDDPILLKAISAYTISRHF